MYKIFTKSSRLLGPVIFAYSLLLLSIVTVYAVTQSYQTNDPALLPGMVVSLEDSSGDTPIIKRAGLSDSKKLIGISTTIEDSLVTLSKANRPVFVVSDGEVDAYVVDTKGNINRGDLLQLSSIRGILELANPESAGYVIGTALEATDFMDAESYISEGENTSGSVKSEKIRIAINNQALAAAANGEKELSGLAKLGLSITGSNIGEVRVLIALIIFMLVMVAEGGIIYGAISSAITALGRNPLAKKFIRQELVRVLLVAVLVLGAGIAAIYAILFA